jgi:hypothetical protein
MCVLFTECAYLIDLAEGNRPQRNVESGPAQLQARENEQKALSIWIKGATFQQITAAGFGIATPSGAWRAVHRALARIPKAEADQAHQAQLAWLQGSACCFGIR